MREYHSISSLKKFEECPRCYWLHYVAGLGEESSPAQQVGIEVHEAIKDYHLGKPISKGLQELSNKLIGVYTENVTQSEFDVPEKKLLVSLENIATGEILPTLFKLIIDGINTKTDWIYEHKTSGYYWKYDDIATNIQATGYAYGYFKVYNKLPNGIRFNILKKNKIKCKYQPLETYRTFEDLVYFFNWAKRIVNEIEVSNFQPKITRFNSHHRLCPYAGRE